MTETMMKEDRTSNDLAGQLLTKAISDAMQPVLDELAAVRKQSLPALRAVSDIYRQIQEIKEMAKTHSENSGERVRELERENHRLREKLKSIGDAALDIEECDADDE